MTAAASTAYLALNIFRANPSKSGKKGRWANRSIKGDIRRISAGINKSTVRRLNTTPFASERPRSKPMLNSITVSTRKPTMVVRLLARMEFSASLIAFVKAVICSCPLSL